MSCPHRNKRRDVQTTFTARRVFDDVARQWVVVELKTTTTTVVCTDCNTTLSTHERTS